MHVKVSIDTLASVDPKEGEQGMDLEKARRVSSIGIL